MSNSGYYFPTLAYAIQEYVFSKQLVVKFVNEFIINGTEQSYNLAVEALNASTSLSTQFSKEFGPSSRILATLPDGTVWYDSSKGNQNTFANYKLKNIDENHASRYSIRQAMDSYEGTGWETKYSTTNNTYEDYYAVRGGPSPQEIGYVIRLSFL
jgi:hypothetical protein